MSPWVPLKPPPRYKWRRYWYNSARLTDAGIVLTCRKCSRRHVQEDGARSRGSCPRCKLVNTRKAEKKGWTHQEWWKRFGQACGPPPNVSYEEHVDVLLPPIFDPNHHNSDDPWADEKRNEVIGWCAFPSA